MFFPGFPGDSLSPVCILVSIMCHIFLQRMSLIMMIQICNLGKLKFSRIVLANMFQHSSYFHSNSFLFHFAFLIILSYAV